jgi:HK97 family phage major capsid protein
MEINQMRNLSSALPPGVPYMAAASIDELRAKQQELLDASAAIVDLADKDDREISDEELATIESNKTEIERIAKQVTARETAMPVAQGQGRKVAPVETAKKVPSQPRDSQRMGFSGLGEFANAVRNHALGNHGDSVNKLTNALTTYGNEGTGVDGGFLVPPEFASMIWKKVEAEDDLMSRCSELTPSGNSMTIPKDETTPWGTSGIQAYWDGEAATISQSKGVFESSTLRLYKLTALAPVTDEMLEDSRGFESWLQSKVPGILSHKINTAIVSGTGAGQPLGILNSASKVSVANATSQPADTVWFHNIQSMWGRMYAPWRRNAVWLINQDVEPHLEAMAFQPFGAASHVPTAASTPVYLPPGGLADAPYGRLKGRPVLPLQACATVGDQGDIILVDLKQYWVLRKAGVRSDTSIHLFFDQNVTAFRFIFRLNGQPAWSAAISPQNGSNTLSWAVVADAR